MTAKYRSTISKIVRLHENYLRSTPRYERYMALENLEEWFFLLGSDVCLLTHGDATAKIARKFIAYNYKHGVKLSKIEISSLMLAARIHDWGEIKIAGKGVGDITFEDKTDEDETAEASFFDKIISAIDDQQIRKEFYVTYQEVVLRQNPKLSEIFNAIERLGYLETAITSYKGKSGVRISNWKGLAGNVLANPMEKLLEYSQKYPYVGYFMMREKKTIEKMFAAIRKLRSVPKDNTNRPSYDILKLQNAYMAWRKWCSGV